MWSDNHFIVWYCNGLDRVDPRMHSSTENPNYRKFNNKREITEVYKVNWKSLHMGEKRNAEEPEESSTTKTEKKTMK